MLAVAWDLLGSKSTAAVCTGSHFISFIELSLSFLGPVKTEIKRLQEKLQWGKLVHLSLSMVS